MILLFLLGLCLHTAKINTVLSITKSPYLAHYLQTHNDKELYHKTKLLVMKNSPYASRYLSKLLTQKVDKKLYIKARILEFFLSLHKNNYIHAEHIISTINTEADKELQNFIYLLQARLYASRQNFTKALNFYQSINKSSRYYRQALIEATFLISTFSGDYNSVIEHLDAMLLWYKSKKSPLPPPNSRLALDFELEKAKTYIKALQLKKAGITYKEFLELYNTVSQRYTKVPKATLLGTKIQFGSCTEGFDAIGVLAFSTQCIKSNLLSTWLKNSEKNYLTDSFNTFNFINKKLNVSTYYTTKYRRYLITLFNKYINIAFSRIKSKLLEAKTGIIQISLSAQELKKDKNKENLKNKLRKLNRLEELYEKALNRI